MVVAGCRALVCDDEPRVRRSIRKVLEHGGITTLEADSGDAALALIKLSPPDVLLVDLHMPGMDGLSLMRAVRQQGYEMPVIVVTGYGTPREGLESAQLGAVDIIRKPFEETELLAAVRRGIESARGVPVPDFGVAADEGQGYHGLVGASPAMQALFDQLRVLEEIDPPSILITGESGTGKELVARAIHERGRRQSGPFVAVDCAAIPTNLLESTLFGHERGAFTDARTTHRGLFEAARGGVLFLDEIGELPFAAQAQLLRSLESRRFRRVGGTEDLELDAVVVAATNRELEAEVASGRFREDLYHRLAIIPLELPPLRVRTGDVPLLVHHYVDELCRKFGRGPKRVAPDALDALVRAPWTGNVRQLRNVLEHAVLFSTGEVIGKANLPAAIRFQPPEGATAANVQLPPGGVALEAVERSLIVQALQRTGGNQSEAAQLLSVSRHVLRTRMNRYGLR